ncbi:HD domain-containing protein [Blautia sp. MSJ-19]|uniref:HD domain-containing protein n=1 Tax=Blautia sp. MSJ-19 TaxID=2841517 RepID=UPI001C0F145A|nr:HD domain-containing protein [Blautia sp. MSJ-19]MBU5481574.1 HD domain-containing protein [Blautia sp. MSJ-19]
MLTNMTRVNAIWEHPLYQQNLKELISLETDRIFCRHTPEHFLDVARLAYIFALERNIACSSELIYCTALLHDIGRAKQYTDGTPHDIAGVQIAEQILSDLDFSDEEKSQILTAIGEHRSSGKNVSPLSQILYEADKKSRMCFLCPAEQECYWSSDKKNMTIQY